MGHTRRARAKMFKSWARLCREHKHNTEHLTHIISILNCLSLSFLLNNLQCIHSSGVECYTDLCTSSNKHGNVNKSPPINTYFSIAGLENNYPFGKSERPWAHELTSKTGGELMSWSPSVSAALYATHIQANTSFFVNSCIILWLFCLFLLPIRWYFLKETWMC